MAQGPARVVWADEAFEAFHQLSFRERERILARVDLLSKFPEMYKVVETGRWRGLRRFFSGVQVIFYGYWPSEGTLYIEVIASAYRSQNE